MLLKRHLVHYFVYYLTIFDFTITSPLQWMAQKPRATTERPVGRILGSARKVYTMAWNDGLEGVHLEIARDLRTPVHVFAGPGTGKTFAMMRRIARILEDDGDPESILAVTFTRTATTDLREQIESLGVTVSRQVRASTVHALCFSVLAEESVFELTHRVPRPLLSHELRALVNDLAGDFGGKTRVTELLKAYEAAWARLQTDIPGGPANDIDAAFHASVLDWLNYHRSMLIGELVPLTLGFLRQNPAVQIVPSFEHVLVDEYQDLNRADQALVEELARGGSLIVVGDDSQSIYSFRHANPEGIRTFPDTHPNTVRYTIEDCRRCPPNIVAISNALIANDSFRAREVPLRAMEGRDNADIFLVQHPTLDDEVEACADYVQNYLNTHRTLPAGQMLVLSPRRLVGNRIRNALISRGLNSLSYFTEDPLQTRAAAEGFCLLTLLVNANDRAALRAWLGMSSSNGLTGGYSRLRAYAESHQSEPGLVLQQIADGDITVPYTNRLAERWTRLQQRLHQIGRLEGLELVRALWPPEEEDTNDIRIIAENLALDTPMPGDFLDELIREITQPHLPDSRSDIVRVMSLHKSKGLTAAVVLIPGCVSGALPYIDPKRPQAQQDSQRAEQRRLFYVAITRATDALVISSAARMPLADAMRSKVEVVRVHGRGEQAIAMTAPSPFLAELGPSAPPTLTTLQWRRAVGF